MAAAASREGEGLGERLEIDLEGRVVVGSGMSEDDQKFWEEEVQALTNRMIGKVDEALEVKQAEIMQV